ncbi:FAD-binding and (Fe-S)-binding domain-containing protein [Kribbella solani]|uniref:FAD-binding and (Fe-S)-binding domain-containing protein n=1 Tax=Kribbella solani TaxID=236067 RepID=UPI0029A09492|nr:FAD-binding and (Fe-S)-binding domain-containing protein [Kribbella solani]MDX3000127.1 FAD-binding and (Fe-S)-binding domain-containing protein [Kribbella solani]
MLTPDDPTIGSTGYDISRLVAALRRELRGEVADDRRTRALYAADGSNYRAVPDLVVVPADADELAAAVTLTAAAGAPVVVRGGGTSMAGNAIGGVVIDTSRYVNRILELDPVARTAIVEPGVVLTDLLAAGRPHGLAFGADPSSASRATLGGMIANNACGAHSVAWGTTADNLQSLDTVLADGTRLTFAAATRDALTGRDPLTGHDGLASRDALADRGASGARDGLAGREALAARPGREGELHRALQSFVDRNELLIRRRFGQFTRQISGYALHRLLPEYGSNAAGLLAGSEGGLAATLRATVRLTELPKAKVLCVLGFTDSITSADCVPVVLRHHPLTMESINNELVDRLPAEVRDAAVSAGLPPGNAWLLVEVGADDEPAAAGAARTMLEELRDSGSPATASLVTDPKAQAVLWRCRTDAAGLATRRADGAEAWGGWEDAAVPPERLGAYLRGLDGLLGRHGLSGASYGHFGEGCMHMRIDFDLLSTGGVATYRNFVDQAADLVVELGGSVSGEHGDGRARGELLSKMYGADGVALFGELKRIWDPAGVLNPGMIVDPPRLGLAIRHDGAAKNRHVATLFDYPDDEHDFARAQRRCVGIGKCRQTSGSVMCPSYQVTREELHSTRGRAHLLWEMLQGDLITDGWRSTEVRDGLDLCLSCKGCLSDCPVNVDLATYKAEFTHHHYARRPWARPWSHWSMGWLPLWSRFASRAPKLANRFAGLQLTKRLGGIAAERAVPPFATETFAQWFNRREGSSSRSRSEGERGGRKVVLWPDTFTNYLAPEVGRAAVEVLEAAGFEVVLPDKPVCCGLTWISTGQLTTARRVLNRSVQALAPHLAAGTPIVGLEPSCTAALRDDARRLLVDNPLVDSLAANMRTFAELLVEAGWKPPRVGGEAYVQPHCHQHAVLGFDADRELMSAAGIDARLADPGCCGLAGNFGFERDHYELSKAVGERTLLPAVRSLPDATTVLADGFSCRTQISQGTPRRPHHLAELLATALPNPNPTSTGADTGTGTGTGTDRGEAPS